MAAVGNLLPKSHLDQDCGCGTGVEGLQPPPAPFSQYEITRGTNDSQATKTLKRMQSHLNVIYQYIWLPVLYQQMGGYGGCAWVGWSYRAMYI